MRVCQIVPSLEERHGGPSKSVDALAHAFAALDQDVDLLATHPLTPGTTVAGRLRQSIFHRDWPQSLCPSQDLRAHLRTLPCDLIHHHSLWLRTLHYAHARAAAAGVPLVVSPRGMMSDWAWNHHHARKQVARRLVHPGAFEAAAGWHATSSAEADEIRSRGITAPVCVAPNGVNPPGEDQRRIERDYWREACPDVTRRRTALFYSRFHRKKRVLELIDLWLRVAPPDWVLLLVGLPEEYTSAQLDTYVLRASGGGRIHVFDGESRPAPYAVASLFLLPSHNENFGLVVAEAMAHGVPALVTDTTPWGVLNTAVAGWCVPWDDYPEVLRLALAAPAAELAARGSRAEHLASSDFSWSAAARVLLAFYAELRARTRRPT